MTKELSSKQNLLEVIDEFVDLLGFWFEIETYENIGQKDSKSTGSSMLDGKINLIEGVRKICSLRHAVGDPDNEVFLSIRAIDSETDPFPIGQIRDRCTREYLQRMDKEMQLYVADAKDDILTACRKNSSSFH